MEEYPEIIMNQHYAVIKPADRLYKDDTQVNHPCHAKSKCVRFMMSFSFPMNGMKLLCIP